MDKREEREKDKQLNRVLTAGFFISLLPILILAFYNYPAADDFSASDSVKLAWTATGSLWEVLKAAWENVRYNYESWSGVFASVFWTSLQPGIFGEEFYGMTTALTLVLLPGAGFYLSRVISRKYLGSAGCTMNAITVLFLFTLIQLMPDGNEGLYWHAGVVNYTWAFAFFLLLIGAVLSFYRQKKQGRRVLQSILACLLSVLVGGGNYITALQGTLVLLLAVSILCLWEKKKKRSLVQIIRRNYCLLLSLAVTLFAFGASVLAPGNAVRMGMSTGMQPVEAIVQSFVCCFTLPVEEWLSWHSAALLFLALPLMHQIAERVNYDFPYPLLAAALILCLVSAGFTPSLYAQGSVTAGRLQNAVYFFSILGLYGVSFYFVGWCSKKGIKRPKIKGKELIPLLFMRERLLVWGLLVLFCAGSLFHFMVNRKIYIGTEAAEVLVSGQAEIYRQENEERLQLLKDSSRRRVAVKPFSNPPELLLFQDIAFDEAEWINTAVAKYYGKESVKVEY